jgi:hypothetical protein
MIQRCACSRFSRFFGGVLVAAASSGIVSSDS